MLVVVAVLGGILAKKVVRSSPAGADTTLSTTVVGGEPERLLITRTVTGITFVVDGASGDDGQATGEGTPGRGGVGARVRATFPVGHGYRVGDTLLLVPGAAGWERRADGPLAGGPGGTGLSHDGGSGGWGGGGSGVLNETTGEWLLVAGGGGGGSGGGAGEFSGRPGGDAGHHGGSAESIPGLGGAAGAHCTGSAAAVGRGGAGGSSTSGVFNGAGGGGGGGCRAGGGGRAGGLWTAGGGGGRGGRYEHPAARDVTSGPAPLGHGSVTAHITHYWEPAPELLDAGTFELRVGEPVHVDIRASGTPPPEFTRVEGTWPEGVRFRVPLFSGRGEIRGTPAPGSEGRYDILLSIRNDWGGDTTRIRLVVLPPADAPADPRGGGTRA